MIRGEMESGLRLSTGWLTHFCVHTGDQRGR